MKHKYVILALFAAIMNFCIMPSSFSEETAYAAHPNAVGFFSGTLGGTGLHYQRWLDRVGFQITGGVLYAPQDDANIMSWFGGYGDEYVWTEPGTSKSYISYYRTSLYYSVGVEFLFMLTAQDMTKWFSGNLYVFGGIGHSGLTRYYYEPLMKTYLLEDGTPDYYWIENPAVKVDGGFVPSLSFGGGIGVEPLFFKRLSMPLEVGYYLKWKNFQPHPDYLEANIMFQTGLRYRF